MHMSVHIACFGTKYPNPNKQVVLGSPEQQVVLPPICLAEQAGTSDQRRIVELGGATATRAALAG